MEILDLLQRQRGMRVHLASVAVLLLDEIAPLILAAHPPDQDAGIDDGEDDEAEHDGMALDEARRAVVDVRAHDGEALAKDLGDGPGGASLGEAARVDAQPGHKEDDARVQARGDEAGRKDLDVGRRHRHQQDVAQRHGRQRADQEHALAVELVRCPRDDGQNHRRTRVWDHREQKSPFCISWNNALVSRGFIKEGPKGKGS